MAAAFAEIAIGVPCNSRLEFGHGLNDLLSGQRRYFFSTLSVTRMSSLSPSGVPLTRAKLLDLGQCGTMVFAGIGGFAWSSSKSGNRQRFDGAGFGMRAHKLNEHVFGAGSRLNFNSRNKKFQASLRSHRLGRLQKVGDVERQFLRAGSAATSAWPRLTATVVSSAALVGSLSGFSLENFLAPIF